MAIKRRQLLILGGLALGGGVGGAAVSGILSRKPEAIAPTDPKATTASNAKPIKSVSIIMLNGKANAEWTTTTRHRSSCSDLNGAVMKKTHSVDFSRMTIRTSRTEATAGASTFSRRAARGSFKE